MKNVIKWSELFPTKWSFTIFMTYIILFAAQGILVTKSQTSQNLYNYDISTVVLLTEALKLVASVLLYCRTEKLNTLGKEFTKNKKLFLLYFIPAFLYSIYNNLSFINLSSFDPTTYYLLFQFRVVITGILFQTIFKKKLSQVQWFSLILLTAGCMIKQLQFGREENPLHKNTTGIDFSISTLLLFIQILISCFAGVYNEYLLKNDGIDVNIFVQNMFMYIDSIICNFGVIAAQGNLSNTFKMENLALLSNTIIIVIMFNNAAVGIITSLFLKNMNSILKTFVSAIDLALIAFVSYIFLGISIGLNTLIAIVVVSTAVILYSRNPVNNTVIEKLRSADDELIVKESA